MSRTCNFIENDHGLKQSPNIYPNIRMKNFVKLFTIMIGINCKLPLRRSKLSFHKSINLEVNRLIVKWTLEVKTSVTYN